MPLLKATRNKESVNLRVREITERTGCMKATLLLLKEAENSEELLRKGDAVRVAPNVCLSLFSVLRALCVPQWFIDLFLRTGHRSCALRFA
jgi:hypothetical protein